MADKKAATSPNKPVRRRTKVQTITITPEQAINFLNRITGALERVESMHAANASSQHGSDPSEAKAQINYGNASGSLDKPKPAALDGMIFCLRDLAFSVGSLTDGLRRKLYNEPPPAENSAGCAPSMGVTKDAVSQTHSAILQIQQDILAIGDYIIN